VIGNGAAGTAANPRGGAGGWFLGDGGAGWNSTAAGVAGGAGGSGGLFGTGGAGGAGGAGAAGGTGGSGGWLMGIGGTGGSGGDAADGGIGGRGGLGGDATGLVFGIGGHGGDGGDGTTGGRGGNGGDGAALLGSGGNGGDAGTGGVGGGAVGLPALGGAGGIAGWFGTHGAVGRSDLSGLVNHPADGPVLTLSPEGNWLTNSDGQVVILHGVNEVYKLDPYDPAASGFGDDDAEFLAANGFNVVRLGIIWAAVEPEPGVFDMEYLDSIDRTVQTLADHGIYTILDMHQDNYGATFAGEGAPDWATYSGGLPNLNFGFPGSYYLNPAMNHAWDSFWRNADAPNGLGLQDNYALAWEVVAFRFSGNPAVIGYDIMNEAWPGSSWPVALLGGPFFGYQQLTPFYNQVAAAIRAVDPTTPLFIEPANPGVTEVGDILGVPVNLGTVDDPYVVLAFHDYCGGSATSGICSGIANALADRAKEYATKHGIPAFMNEFGATDATSDLNAQMRAANRYMMGWTVWAYTGKGDITTSGSPNAEALVYDPALPPVGDNVNTGNLATLAVPYPQLISGTPKGWSAVDGTFLFSYSTEKVDGSGSFAAGSQTVISVPAVAYPNGYEVTVTGGHVVSAPNAPKLVIVSDDGAATVNVVVKGIAQEPSGTAQAV
jgi:endoglycosylceramidase